MASSESSVEATYRSGLIGCGARTAYHAQAYAHVSSAKLVTACDLDSSRRDEFKSRFGFDRVYEDLGQMLDENKLDIVHVVTHPSFRIQPLRACAEAGVKAVILEKPMANTLDEAQQIVEIARSHSIRVVVNTQRRFIAGWPELRNMVQSGEAGRIRFIRINTPPPLSFCGAHLIDMVEDLMNDVAPESVLATATGATVYGSTHPGPDHVLASIHYQDGVQVLWESGKQGPGISIGSAFDRTELDIITDRGRLWFSDFNGWGYHLDGQPNAIQHPTNFSNDQDEAQGQFTEQVCRWLGDEGQLHPNHLGSAFRVFQITMAIIQSAVEGRRIPFEQDQLRDCCAELQSRLESQVLATEQG